ncbi:hypothetical protein [Methylobacterium sp. CM6257]
MTSPLLISVVFALVTTGVATLWAAFVATGMEAMPEPEAVERRDIRTW